MDKYIGRLLDNRYEILEVIGSGGMAVVYKARCHRLNRLVAIKILKDDYLQDEDFRRRFHAESHAVAMLSHPNIVQVYDVFDSAEADYIVMELIDGISLKQYMEKKGVLNWKETLHFAIQIAKALEHAHSRGIVHRDIKPHNVMVLKNGSVKVTDFGIARMMSKGNTLTKEALGSVHYISPEQAKGGRVDNRSDIYSLGVVMYEMMSGRPPYDGESPVSVAIQHINGGAVMPSTLNPNIPGGLEQIIMKAMSLAVADRFGSAAAMLHDLDEFRKDPAILFDYNVPPIDEVLQIKKAPLIMEMPKQEPEVVAIPEPPKMTAQPAPPPVSPRKPAAPATNSVASRKEAPRRRTTQQKQSNASTIAIISCSVVMLLAIAILLIVIFNPWGGEDTEKLYTVPNLIGKQYSTLPSYPGITIEEEKSEYNDTVPKGQIISQDPEADKKVTEDTVVRVVVSLGPEVKEEDTADKMLNLVNMTYDNASSVLKPLKDQLELTIIQKIEPSETVVEGCIIRTEPAADTKLNKGDKVTLYVSSGKEIANSSDMPSVIGYTQKMAEDLLNGQGLDLKIVPKEESSETVEVGNIIRSEPEKGEKLEEGQTVYLYISTGPEPKMPDIEGKTLADLEDFFNRLSIEITLKSEEEFHDTIPAGEAIRSDVEKDKDLTNIKEVTVYFSRGPEPVIPEDIVGKTYAEAQKIINDLKPDKDINIIYLQESQYHETVEVGKVCGSNPEVGTSLVGVEEITIYISEGPEMFEMIDVLGYQYDTAVLMLNEKGFNNISKNPVPGVEGKTAGAVAAQGVAPGTSCKSAVEIVLDVYGEYIPPAVVTKQVTITVQEPWSTGEHTFEVYRASDGVVVFDAQVMTNQGVLMLGEQEGSGTVKYIVYVDGTEAFTYEVFFS